MKKFVSLSGLLILVILFAGCVAPKMYYYGDYSKTLYHYEKDQNEESLIKHQQELEKIIAESETKNCRIPPGICAELGFLKMKNNDSKEAVRLFAMESSLYPESKILMDRLIQKVEVGEKEVADKPADGAITIEAEDTEQEGDKIEN